MADILQFIPKPNPNRDILDRLHGMPMVRYDGPRDPSDPNGPVNIWPDISPLECMAIDIVNEIFPDSAPAEYNYQADADDPA